MADSEHVLTEVPPAADVRLQYGSDPNQFGDLRLPKTKGPHPVAMMVHGGFWRAKYDLVHAGHLCDALTKSGVATWNLEYRRVGNSGGGWPGTFEDVSSGFAFLRQVSKQHHLNENRVMVLGHSAGGELALCLAAHQRSLRGALSLAGVVDLRRAWELHLSNDAVVEFLGGTPAEVPEHYREASPAERSIPHAVQRLVHGTADDSVPYEISKNYADRKKKSGENAELITLPETGHFEIVDPGSIVWPKIEQLFLALTNP